MFQKSQENFCCVNIRCRNCDTLITEGEIVRVLDRTYCLRCWETISSRIERLWEKVTSSDDEFDKWLRDNQEG